MQFKEFDNKAKEAADHHHPAYDEQAWVKMEKLLNKHLPQKEKGRRRLLFIFLLFLGMGGAGLLIVKPWNSKNSIAENEQTVQQMLPVIPIQGSQSNEVVSGSNKDDGEHKLGNTDEFLIGKKENPSSAISVEMKTQGKDQKNSSPKNSNNIQQVYKPQNIIKNADVPGKNADKVSLTLENEIKEEAGDNKLISTTKNVEPINNFLNADNKQPENVADKYKAEEILIPVPNEQPTNDEVKKERNKTKKTNSLYFSLSAGPDVSFVGSNKLGTKRIFGGVGIGYSINNRLTIRTGLYSGRKIYTASPDAYHPPSVFYTYYPYLEKVDANCKVYEIPLSFSYNFGNSIKENWFASAGLSSLLMKNETYTYFYKYSQGGPTLNRKWTIINENKHFFSILTLSGGYQRSINKHISLTVEPYIKVPLSGVGYGKVKLNSGGVLFSVGVKPFARK